MKSLDELSKILSNILGIPIYYYRINSWIDFGPLPQKIFITLMRTGRIWISSDVHEFDFRQILENFFPDIEKSTTNSLLLTPEQQLEYVMVYFT